MGASPSPGVTIKRAFRATNRPHTTGGSTAFAVEKPKVLAMADLTYDPDTPRRPRPIAQPFGMLANPWPTPDPNQTPGLNVQSETSPQPATNPMMGMLASFMPSGETWKQGVADTLGAPVDGLAWALHMMGVPISGDEFYGGGTFNRGPGTGRPTWTPGPSVPFGSQNIRGMIDNPPNISVDQLLRAMRRPGLF